MMERSCGILLPIYALPSPGGIGTFGADARHFVDFLHAAGQKWWQLLPLGPTSCGDSPYQSFSGFAGNPYLIDLTALREDGLLTQREIDSFDFGADSRHVDYGKLYRGRLALLSLAKARGWERDRAALDRFREENAHWLPDYALFMALKRHFRMASWPEWPDEDIRFRRPDAVARYSEALREDTELFIYLQFLFFRQYAAFRSYANAQGIRLLGDVPIYTALDSADVWSAPEQFLLDGCGRPCEVAGVPPDYFSEDGQLWGNPLYDYDAMRKDGFSWWIRRIGAAARLFDAIRIDHFRGFERFWAVPFGEKTAKNGHWVEGPGMSLVGTLTAWFHDTQFIAEDLGQPSEGLRALLHDSGLPGIRVLEFAFGSGADNPYLPHNHERNSVCCTGTHDNAPLALWCEEADGDTLRSACAYLGVTDRSALPEAMLRCGMASVADLFIAQMQDYLLLGRGHRTNLPGSMQGNWSWRMLPDEADDALAERLRMVSERYGRAVNA